MEIKVLLVIILVFGTLFILAHLKPLDENEVKQLASARRKNNIRKYFEFTKNERLADDDFKKNMKSNGKFYKINEYLSNFPAVASALLKYKKHEWIIIGFEKMSRVDLVWLNKGFDKASATTYLSLEDITKTAKSNHCNSVVFLHNHPNSNPNYCSCHRPSERDIETGKELAFLLNSAGVNLVEFICERGKYYEYLLSPTDTFFPILNFITDINHINGSSRFNNFKLHLERIFS